MCRRFQFKYLSATYLSPLPRLRHPLWKTNTPVGRPYVMTTLYNLRKRVVHPGPQLNANSTSRTPEFRKNYFRYLLDVSSTDPSGGATCSSLESCLFCHRYLICVIELDCPSAHEERTRRAPPTTPTCLLFLGKNAGRFVSVDRFLCYLP